MKLKLFIVFFCIILLLLQSCAEDNILNEYKQENTDNIDNVSIDVVDGRLFFDSQEDFDLLLQSIKRKDKANINFPTHVESNKFVALKDSHISKEIASNMEIKGMMGGDDILASAIKTGEIDENSLVEMNEELKEELVPQDELKQVLNKDYELQIGEHIYKVTPLGTFVATPQNIDMLNEKLKDGSLTKSILESDKKDKLEVERRVLASYSENSREIKRPCLIAVDEDILSDRAIQKIELSAEGEDISIETVSDFNTSNFGKNEILLNDTYRRRYDECPDAPYIPPHQDPAPPPKTLIDDNMPNESDFVGFNFDAKTFLGKGLQALFGRNRYQHNYFHRKSRVGLNLYAYNYVFTSSIGLKAKVQKRKNFILNYWKKDNAEEIRLGVKYIRFEVKDPKIKEEMARMHQATKLKSFLNSWSQYDIKKDYENLDKSILVEMQDNGLITTEAISNGYDIHNVLVFNFIGKDGVEVKITDRMIYSIFKVGKSFINSMPKKNRSLYNINENKKYSSVGIRLFNSESDKIIVYYEDLYYSQKNTSRLNHTFDSDWGFYIDPPSDLKGKTSTTGSTIITALKTVVDMVRKSPVRKYKIQKADVYGVAKKDGKWKGVRITK